MHGLIMKLKKSLMIFHLSGKLSQLYTLFITLWHTHPKQRNYISFKSNSTDGNLNTSKVKKTKEKHNKPDDNSSDSEDSSQNRYDNLDGLI